MLSFKVNVGGCQNRNEARGSKVTTTNSQQAHAVEKLVGADLMGTASRAHEGIIPTRDIGPFFSSFRPKFARHWHSKFSLTQGYRMLSRHSTLPFSSRHAPLPKIWPWHSTLWPPFMGPASGCQLELGVPILTITCSSHHQPIRTSKYSHEMKVNVWLYLCYMRHEYLIFLHALQDSQDFPLPTRVNQIPMKS